MGVDESQLMTWDFMTGSAMAAIGALPAFMRAFLW